MGPKNNSALEFNPKFLIKNINVKTFKQSNIQNVTLSLMEQNSTVIYFKICKFFHALNISHVSTILDSHPAANSNFLNCIMWKHEIKAFYSLPENLCSVIGCRGTWASEGQNIAKVRYLFSIALIYHDYLSACAAFSGNWDGRTLPSMKQELLVLNLAVPGMPAQYSLSVSVEQRSRQGGRHDTARNIVCWSKRNTEGVYCVSIICQKTPWEIKQC